MPLIINGIKYGGAYQNGHNINAYFNGDKIFSQDLVKIDFIQSIKYLTGNQGIFSISELEGTSIYNKVISDHLPFDIIKYLSPGYYTLNDLINIGAYPLINNNNFHLTPYFNGDDDKILEDSNVFIGTINGQFNTYFKVSSDMAYNQFLAAYTINQ